jgi:hypothetical protein
MFTCKPLSTRTAGEDTSILSLIDMYTVETGHLETMCWYLHRWHTVKTTAPQRTNCHRTVQGQALSVKRLQTVLHGIAHIMNVINAKPLNSRAFLALCDGMGSTHTKLLLHRGFHGYQEARYRFTHSHALRNVYIRL